MISNLAVGITAFGGCNRNVKYIPGNSRYDAWYGEEVSAACHGCIMSVAVPKVPVDNSGALIGVDITSAENGVAAALVAHLGPIRAEA